MYHGTKPSEGLLPAWAMPSLAACSVLAWISVQVTGFELGVGNNVFHIPYVLKLEKTPEFATDPLYLSLKNFTSILWPILRLIASEENIYQLFYISSVISRFSGLLGMALVFRLLGIDCKGTLLALWVACLTPWLQNYSMVGKHGMFISYLTHSELTWLSVLASLALLPKKKYTAAFISAGISFSINAFVGIWTLSICLYEYAINIKPLGRKQILWPPLAFSITALPVILWIAVAIANGSNGEGFSYLEYVRTYYPEHFLIEAAPWRAIMRLCLIFLIGLIASRYYENEIAAYWIRIQWICASLFLIGCIAPYIVDSRFVFNLHLLRIDGIEQMVSVLLLIGAGIKLLLDMDSRHARVLGLLILFALTKLDGSISTLILLGIAASTGLLCGSGQKYILPRLGSRSVMAVITYVVAALLLATFLSQSSKQEFDYMGGIQLILSIVALVVASKTTILAPSQLRFLGIVAVLYLASATMDEIQRTRMAAAEKDKVTLAERGWFDLVRWIRTSDLHGVFLVPINGQSDYFQLEARRRVWVDWKQGAAVMWSPSFHSQWASRYREVAALTSPGQFVQYAKSKAIDYVVIRSDSAICPAGSSLIRAEPHYVLCGAQT